MRKSLTQGGCIQTGEKQPDVVSRVAVTKCKGNAAFHFCARSESPSVTNKRSGRRNKVTVSGAMKAWLEGCPVSLGGPVKVEQLGSPFMLHILMQANSRQTSGERHADYSTNLRPYHCMVPGKQRAARYTGAVRLRTAL